MFRPTRGRIRSIGYRYFLEAAVAILAGEDPLPDEQREEKKAEYRNNCIEDMFKMLDGAYYAIRLLESDVLMAGSRVSRWLESYAEVVALARYHHDETEQFRETVIKARMAFLHLKADEPIPEEFLEPTQELMQRMLKRVRRQSSVPLHPVRRRSWVSS